MTPDREGLARALRSATVALTTDDSVGTGVFVAPSIVLTCAHVVSETRRDVSVPVPSIRGRLGDHDHDDIELDLVPGWFRPRDGGGPDLALLRTRDLLDHGVAPLAKAFAPGDEMLAFGYPDGDYRGGDSLTLRAEGESLRIDGNELLRASQGRAVAGYSGSPALNWRTGMVCGIVRLGSHQSQDPTSRIIPAAVVMAAFPDVFGTPARPADWLDLLTEEQLRAAGVVHPGPWLREYFTAAVHRDWQATAFGERKNGRKLLDVYQPGRLRVAGGAAPEPAETSVEAGSLLVLGGPGSGKSSLLRWLRHRALRRWQAGEGCGYIPVLVHAKALVSSGSADDPVVFSAAVAAEVTRDLHLLLASPPPTDLFRQQALPAIPWLLLVDGFEELLESDERRAVLGVLAYWSGRSEFRLLIASRPSVNGEFDALRGIRQAELVDLDADQLTALATSWLGAPGRTPAEHDVAAARQLTAQIESGQIHELGHNPLIATLLCRLHRDDPQVALPNSRYEIYERFVASQRKRQLHELKVLPRLREIAGTVPRGMEAVECLVEQMDDLLTEFALRRGYSAGLTPREQAVGGLAAFAADWTEPIRPALFDPADWADLVMDVLRQSGLAAGDDVLHRTIADFLVAQALTTGTGDAHPSPERVSRTGYLLNNRSLVSFIAAQWQRTDPARLRHLCEILHRRGWLKREFLATLVEDGVAIPGDVLERITANLATLANNPTADPSQRLTSAALLSRIDWRRARPRLLALALEPGADLTTDSLALNPRLHGLNAIDILTRHDPEITIGVLLARAREPRLPAERRLDAALRLSALDAEAAVPTLEELAADGSQPAETTLASLRGLGSIAPKRALRLVPGIVARAGLGASAALAVAEFDNEAAVPLLAALARDPAIPHADRVTVSRRWAELGDAAEPRDILTALATDSSLPSDVRWHAATDLAGLAPNRAVPLLEKLTKVSVDATTRARAAARFCVLQPERTNDVIPRLGDLDAVQPDAARELFTAWAAHPGPGCAAAVRRYLATLNRRRYQGWQKCFAVLADILHRLDPQQCVAALRHILQPDPRRPDIPRIDVDLLNVWRQTDPSGCADHLASTAQDDTVALDSRGIAIAWLGAMNDPRAVPIAENAIADVRPRGDFEATLFCVTASRGMASVDPDRGARMMADLALDQRLDAGARNVGANELHIYDAELANEVLRVLEQDAGVRAHRRNFAQFSPNFDDSAQARELLTARFRDHDDQAMREDAIAQLLELAPAHALDLLMAETAHEDPRRAAWAYRRLTAAVEELQLR